MANTDAAGVWGWFLFSALFSVGRMSEEQGVAIELSFSAGALYFIVWIYFEFYQSANDEQVVFLIYYITINTFM